jgi:hypothetical protein
MWTLFERALFASVLMAVPAVVFAGPIQSIQFTVTSTFSLPGSPGRGQINNNGDVAFSSGSPEAPYIRQANGTVIPIAGFGSDGTVVYGFNDSNEIVGAYGAPSCPYPCGFLSTSYGSYTQIIPSTIAAGVNNIGTVVGDVGDGNIFIRAVNGSATTFTYGPSNNASAIGINDSGQIVGSYCLALSGCFNFFYRDSNGAITDITSLLPTGIPGFPTAGISGILDNGAVFGSYTASEAGFGSVEYEYDPSSGITTIINGVPGGGLTGSLLDISSNGLEAFGFANGSYYVGTLGIPAPEPATWMASILGVALLFLMACTTAPRFGWD